MHQWWMAAAVPIVGALGYLIRRWIEGRARSELLKRRLQALALHQGMERSGLSLGDLDKLGQDP